MDAGVTSDMTTDPKSVPPLLSLNASDLIAEGSQRWVYRHPADRTKLVKVLRPMPETTSRAKLATWTEAHFPNIRRRWARKEYQEYLRMMLAADPAEFHSPITHMFGFTMTDKGLGCLTEAVTNDNGLGPTLDHLIKSKSFTRADLTLFNDCVARLDRYDIRAGDMTPRNFVFGHRDYAGTPGLRECVLVDGFGDVHAIPIRSLSRWANRIGMADNCRRLAQRTGLRWDAETRQFHLT